MADILIRGIKMPKQCYLDCPFLIQISKDTDHEAFNYCVLENWKTSKTPTPFTNDEAKGVRQPFCLLNELPPHGDLIDRNEYICMMERKCNSGYSLDSFVLDVCRRNIKKMPIVVPADKETQNAN